MNSQGATRIISVALIALIATSAGFLVFWKVFTPAPDHGAPSSSDRCLQEDRCLVPFARLAAFPERYEGKRIAISGYLVTIGAKAYLFPSRESFETGAMWEAVGLNDQQRTFDPGIEATMVGIFGQASSRNGDQTLGVMRDAGRYATSPFGPPLTFDNRPAIEPPRPATPADPVMQSPKVVTDKPPTIHTE